MLRPHDRSFIPLDKHWNVTHGRTDRQTDRSAVANTSLCIASNADAVKTCDQYAIKFDIQFTSRKSVAVCIGTRYDDVFESLELADVYLRYIMLIQ